MEINKVVILGDEESGAKIQDLLSEVELKGIMPDLKGDYSQELSDADMILENLPGDMELKKEILRKCSKKAPQKTIFATTASWGITELAAAAERRQNFIGLNFTCNPFTMKYLVQITKGFETSEETITTCRELVDKVGATSVVLEDSPGLVLDRGLAVAINEAALVHISCSVSIEDIDKAMKLFTNWPMGPFEFADTIGVDKVVDTLEILSQQIGSQYSPCRLLRYMVASGRLGKKTGRGFYTYS